MAKTSYERWINGDGCCGAHNFLTISGNCKTHDDACSCENILLEISKLWTNDEILQDEIDELSGTSISGYATQDWVIEQGYLTDADLSNYALKTDIPTVPTDVSAFYNDVGYLTEHQSLSGYVPTSTFIQYINNLQEQINSLVAEISGCCASSGETQYRWITETGENDYWCSGTTKMTKEKQQSSTDGINWTDTGVERSGSTVLETDCVDCGYVPVYGTKLTSHYNNGNTKVVMCTGVWEDGFIDRPDYNIYETGASGLTSAEIGDCPTIIAGYCFSGCTNLTGVTIPNNITSIGAWSFMGCIALSSVTIPSSVTYISQSAFIGCNSLSTVICNAVTPPNIGSNVFPNNSNLVIYVPAESVETYKTARYWSDYASRIQAIV